ncbi:MAG: hypothetical protein IMZ61_05510 [Planctomycetes bacterium]|nr:hypothetical protein [Planctomycetota bacterium]
MTDLKDLTKKRDNLSTKAQQFTADLANLETQTDQLRESIADAMLSDQDTTKAEKELEKLEGKSKLIKLAQARAGEEIGKLNPQIARLELDRDIARYLALEKKGWEQMRAFVPAVEALEKKRLELEDTADQMGMIAISHQEFNMRAEMPTKTARMQNLGHSFKEELFNILYELSKFVPDLVKWRSPKTRSANIGLGEGVQNGQQDMSWYGKDLRLRR